MALILWKFYTPTNVLYSEIRRICTVGLLFRDSEFGFRLKAYVLLVSMQMCPMWCRITKLHLVGLSLAYDLISLKANTASTCTLWKRTTKYIKIDFKIQNCQNYAVSVTPYRDNLLTDKRHQLLYCPASALYDTRQRHDTTFMLQVHVTDNTTAGTSSKFKIAM